MKDNIYGEYAFLNRDMIKYIAMLTMLLNHIALIFLDEKTILFEVLKDIGYFTAITMCYFLVEGYWYTKSRKQYGQRLFLFALLSEIPYCFAFTTGKTLEFTGCNMLVNLFLCFLIIHMYYKGDDGIFRWYMIAFFLLCSLICDWSLFAPVFTLLFLKARTEGSRSALKKAFIVAVVFFGVFNLLNGIGQYSLPENFIYTLGSMTAPALAGMCILYAYNGKRMEVFAGFSKWFFYFFYPVHLGILGMIRFYMGL